MMPARALPADPLAVFAENDANRRPDADDAGLWTADEVYALAVDPAAAVRVPTLCPPRWGPPRRLTQAAYSAEFDRRHPLAASVLRHLNADARGPARVYVAGGAAAAPYYEPECEAGDVDFFVVGADPADEGGLWALAHGVARAVGEGARTRDPGRVLESIVQRLIPGLLMITLHARMTCATRAGERIVRTRREYQVILRAYPSVAALVHGFDVGACCVAYDGAVARMSTLGAFAQARRVNLVNPAYRSTTYERRLAKYLARGYALGLVHLAPGAFAAGARLELPHCNVVVCAARAPLLAVGGLELPPGAPESDYVGARGSWANAYETARINAARLVAGDPRYLAAASVNTVGAEPYVSLERQLLPLVRFYADRAPPRLGALLSRDMLCWVLDHTAALCCARPRGVNARALTRYLGLSAAQVAVFAAQVFAARAERPGAQIDAASALSGFRAAVLRRYDEERLAPVEWWRITTDPARQYTAARNPRLETPAEWYGPFVRPAGPPVLLVLSDAPAAPGSPPPPGPSPPMANLSETNPPAVDPPPSRSETSSASSTSPPRAACALCRAPLAATDQVSFGCGHAYHWSSDAGPGRWRPAGRRGDSCGGYAGLEGRRDWAGAAGRCLVCTPDSEATLAAQARAQQAAAARPVTLVIRHADWPAADDGPRAPAAVYDDGACAICLTPIAPPDSRVVLRCGHVFHWAAAAECAGLVGWLAARNRTCPTCRALVD